MKITRNICIDLEVWNDFVKKTDNFSQTINELIKTYNSNIPEIERKEIEILKQEINDNIIKIAKLNEQIEKDKKKPVEYKQRIKSKWEKLEEARQQLKANNWDYNKVEG